MEKTYKEKPKAKEYSCMGCCFLHEFRKIHDTEKGRKVNIRTIHFTVGVYITFRSAVQ